jgi:ABC-type proline/glycine betaine transport system permease subunit
MKLILPLALLTAAQSAAAHEGHGDTVLHALAHFFEGDGLFAWLAVLIVGGIALYRFSSQRSRNK